MFFKASLDNTSKILTAAIFGFNVIFFILFMFQLKDMGPIMLIPIFILIPIILFTFLYQPLGYELTMDNIEIHRRINKFYIPKNEIDSISHISGSELGNTWRMMGNGGLFGYTGYFHSSNLGKMRWFVTQRNHYVIIRKTDGKKILISPDDPDGFVQAFHQNYFG